MPTILSAGKRADSNLQMIGELIAHTCWAVCITTAMGARVRDHHIRSLLDGREFSARIGHSLHRQVSGPPRQRAGHSLASRQEGREGQQVPPFETQCSLQPTTKWQSPMCASADNDKFTI
jgi:hypothetical protein